MKLKKIAAAAVALVMAASMMAVPAFADTTNEGNGIDQTGKSTTDRTASTQVNVIYSKTSGNISVTVPLWVMFSVDNKGDLKTPSDQTYKITNESAVPVYISEIKVTPADGIKLVETTNSSDSDQEVSLTMTTDKDSHAGLNLVTDNAGAEKVQDISAQKSAWAMTASGDTTNGNVLSITFSNAKVNRVNSKWVKEAPASLNENSGSKLFTITYTVEAGTLD